MIRPLYDWMIKKAQSPASEKWLAGISFIESSVFPIPIDLMLIPMILANVQKAFRLATITLIFSVLGGVAGYLIGALLYEAIGQHIVALYGYEEKFATFRHYYEDWGVLIVLVAGFTPLPFKVVTIASGVVGMNPLVFLLASIPARGGRFYLVAGLLWWLGDPIRDFIEKRLGLVTTAMLALGIAGFVAIKYI